jgi:hypothetical protein
MARPDDTTAVQNGINYVKANGGTLIAPVGTYKITSTLNCGNNAKSFRITGVGGTEHLNIGEPTFLYTPATGNLMFFQSAIGFELDHLKFAYSNAGYNGDLINLEGSGSNGDVQPWHIHHISTKGVNSSTARSIIRLDRAIIGQISNSQITRAQEGIRVGDPGGAYVVSITIDNNTFNFCSTADIMIGSSDAERITIRENTFKPARTTLQSKATIVNSTPR